jgi:hypothetical protein
MITGHGAPIAAPRAARALVVAASLLAVALSLLFATVAAATPGDTIWSRQSTTSSKGDAFLDVARGPGDVYYCVGITRATEETSAVALVKYKADGKKLWSRTYQSPTTKGAAGACVAVDASGGVIVAGTVGIAPPASGKGRDMVVLKYTPEGSRSWVVTYDGPAHMDDYVADLALDGAGAAYVAGSSRGDGSGQDYAVLAVRGDGRLRWAWRYDGPSTRDAATAVAVDGTGNCYVTGTSQNAGGSITAATAKLSRGGVKVWLKRLQYGEGATEADAIVYRKVGGTRELFLAGSAMGTASTKLNLLIAELRVDTGVTVHFSQVDGNGGDDAGLALAVDSSGNAYAAGSADDAMSDVQHAFVARLSHDGTVPWSKPIWLGPDDNEALFETIALDAAGDPVCGGYGLQPGNGAEWWVQSFLPTGDLRWSNISSGSAGGVDICRSLVATAGGLYAAGQVERTGSGIDAQLKKIAP